MAAGSVIRLVVGAAAALGLASAHLLGAPAPALADVPPAPVAAFDAPACPGTTFSSPQSNTGALAQLLRVFDGDPSDPRISRLEAYEQGNVVPLYDAYGFSDITPIFDPDDSTTTIYPAYPPICATRYVAAAGGPVSEWMYCTDYRARSCADVDEDGFGMYVDDAGVPRYLDTATEPVAPPGNPRLTPDQEKLIAYLIQHGHPYTGFGSYDHLPGGGIANSETTDQRVALQILIWCVSDYGYDPVGDPAFDQTCDASMSPARQQALIDSIPDTPVLTLAVHSPAVSVAAGATARVQVESNVFAQPLTVTSIQPVTVCGGPGSLVGDQLTIAGTDASVPNTVELCVDAPHSGQLTLEVSVVPATTQHIGWNQAGTGDPGESCQVYATFYQDRAATLSDRSTIRVTTGALAAAGAHSPWFIALGALGLLGAGAVLLRRGAAVR